MHLIQTGMPWNLDFDDVHRTPYPGNITLTYLTHCVSKQHAKTALAKPLH
jgi:hypothetical protein